MTRVEDIVATTGWGGFKWYLSSLSGISEDALHVYAGLAVLLLAGWLWRRTPWHILPWSIVLVMELLNEALDLIQHGGREGTLAAAWHDLWMTMWWPTVILLAVPPLLRRCAGPPPAA